jgi:YHS domain-containing protein
MTKIALTLGFVFVSLNLLAADPVYSPFLGDAIKGYDPVAYFTEGKPVKGDSKYTFKWHEGTWRFSSEENLKLFKENPEKYAPQYGGWCAYAMGARKKFVGSDPKLWTMVDGKLYLNYSKSIQKKWDKDRAGYIEKADKNYPELIKK